MAREPGDALQHAHQVGAAVGAGEGMHLVDDDHAQIAEEPGCIHPLGNEHHLQRFGGGHQQLRRIFEEHAAGGIIRVSMPHEAAQAHHLGVEA